MHDGDLPALKNEQGHYNNMIKIKPTDNPFDTVVSTKAPNPENVSRGLTGFVPEHRPFKNKLERCLSGDETLVLSDADNVLSQSETIVDEDDFLSGDEDLLPADEDSSRPGTSVFLTEINTMHNENIHECDSGAKQVDSLLLLSARKYETSLENIHAASKPTSKSKKEKVPSRGVTSKAPSTIVTGAEISIDSKISQTEKWVLWNGANGCTSNYPILQLPQSGVACGVGLQLPRSVVAAW